MADFAHIESARVPEQWINLDQVKRILVGYGPREPYEIVFVDGETMQLPPEDGAKLVAQLNLCCLPSTASRTTHVRTMDPKAETPEHIPPPSRRVRASAKSAGRRNRAIAK